MQDNEALTQEAGPESLAAAGPRLTVADGFRFGCGFSLALFSAVFLFLMIAAVVFLLAMLIGLPLPTTAGR